MACARPSLLEMRGSETILLANDQESIREMARQTLMSLGYRVLAASDGVEALRLCRKNEPPTLATRRHHAEAREILDQKKKNSGSRWGNLSEAPERNSFP